LEEKERLISAGLVPESEVRDLNGKLKEEEARSAAFKASLEEAQAKAKDLSLHPTEVIRWRTKTGQAQGIPLPDSGVEVGSGGAADGPPVSGSTCPPPLPCLVRPGTPLRIDVAEGRLETKAGSRIAFGSAACVRVSPPPEVKIFEQPIELALTEGAVREEVADRSVSRPWIAGVTGIAGNGKWGVGPNLGYFGSRLGISAAITFPNSAGSLSVMGRF
jgi:hypothetical protein